MSFSTCRDLGSSAGGSGAPPRKRKRPSVPEDVISSNYSIIESDDVDDFEDFETIQFSKNIPPYLAQNFNCSNSVHKDGVVLLNDALMGLTITEGKKEENRWAFTVKTKNREFKELVELVNRVKLDFDPGNAFKSVRKNLFHVEVNIRQAIIAFIGQSAMADMLFSQKMRDNDFVSKIILGPLKSQMELIKSLVIGYRYRALPAK